MPSTFRFANPAFAGMLLCAVATPPVCASQASSADSPPALVEGSDCRVVAPTYSPVGRKREAIGSVRFPGGGRLRFLVAKPCFRTARRFDV